ncbi:hypothetical protein DPMN_111239 [Dreissena polymorpha]|uniref:Uncharacterized protein n=1 Tax=Dreissena polymorpha TaxID=45954 RepID=A0A9D4KEI4_DREPO|nr:hypothetical protein DPMN_111239 [Dreissena polymorpha]
MQKKAVALIIKLFKIRTIIIIFVTNFLDFFHRQHFLGALLISNLWEKEQTQTRQLLRGNAWSGSTSNVYKTIVAEDILNAEMLNTVKQYQSYLGEKGKDLNRAVDLRQNTSIIIDT